MEQHRNPPPRGEGVVQEVQALPIQFRAHENNTSDVAAGARVALHPACRDGILASITHDDRDGAGCCPSCPDGTWANRYDDVGLRCDKLDSEGGKALVDIIGGEDLNAEIASFYKSKPRQFREVELTHRACAKLIGGQQANPLDPLRRLCQCRPGEKWENESGKQEVPSPHRITS